MANNESLTDYFGNLNDALKNHHRAKPFLIVDLDIVDENIAAFKSNLKPDVNFRIVVKSLPSPNLIQYINDKMNTNNFMVFHQPFLSDLTNTLDDKADILLGKPMPIKTAHFNPYQQVQWLIDTNDRALQYINLSKKLGKTLRLNLEIDVGLHRGGFRNLDEVRSALKLIEAHSKYVEFSGFMGYDPHVVKIPKIIRSQKKSLRMSNSFYEACKELVKTEFPQHWNSNLTFNGAGSPTVSLHHATDSPLNDIAAGSCFVKPTTFDIPTLNNYKPACFIAAPILKKIEGTTLPGIEKLKSLLGIINSRNALSFFIYGGYWKADYFYPENIQRNALFGNSTNQTMFNAPNTVDLDVDNFVFLRPHQSEFVLLQFGELLIIRTNKIEDSWRLLSNH